MTRRPFASTTQTLLALLLATALHAQQTAAARTQEPDAPDATATSTLQVNVRRVVVDIVVTDAHGKPVTGLPQTAFRVAENGVPQRMRSFEEHISEVQPPLPKPDLPPNTFSNISSAPSSGPVTVILYDLLNTPLEAQPYARAQLLQFLKQRKASGQTAVFVLSDRLHMLQGFTDDEDQLIAALNKQGQFQSAQLHPAAGSTTLSDDLARTAGNQNGADADLNPTFQQIATMLKHMETIESSAMLDERVRITADALKGISRFLVGLPGRKNLLWLSGSFPTGILPDDSLSQRDSFEVSRNYSSTVVEATDLLNLSHVAVYPVDVRGLQGNSMFSAASNQTFEPGQGKDLAAVRTFNQTINAEHSTMDDIAGETGGHAFYNTNGLKEAVASAINDGSAYYTISYAPTDKTLDGSARHVKVELNPPASNAGYTLAYRRTYFADKLANDVAAKAENPDDPLAGALEHGGPVAHELFFEAHLETVGPPTPATAEQTATLAQFAAQNAAQLHPNRKPKPVADAPSGPPVLMQRYVIEYGLLLRQLQTVLGPDGLRRCNLDFAAVAFDSDGNALNGIRSRIQDAIPPARYERLQNGSYQVVQTVAVPANAAWLRVAVRDVGTNHLGSIELQLPLPPQPPVVPVLTTLPK